MKKLLIIQPVLAQYRIPVFAELANHYETIVVSSSPKISSGFGVPNIEGTKIRRHINVQTSSFFKGRLYFQRELISIVKEFKPDKIFACAAPRDIGYLLLLFYCKLINIPVYSHTQGPFNKGGKSIIFKFIYNILNILSYRIILYTPFSYNVLIELGVPSQKLRIASNTIVNNYYINPITKKFKNINGILFIGRLREGVNLDLLFDVLKKKQRDGAKLIIHVIGTGEKEQYFKEKYKKMTNIHWHGEVYNQKKISDISKECFVGCYPGNVGLSVVHYMSLGLPVIIHSKLSLHQGPEASYVINKVNGFTFNPDNSYESLNNCFDELLKLNKTDFYEIAQKAYNTYIKLNNPSLSSKIINILNE